MGYSPEYFKNNKERFAHYGANARDKIKLEMIEAYGGKCKHCGIDNPVVLCLDHVNDDAHVEKEQFGENHRGGHKHYWRLKAEGWPQERFQLLCYNCNTVKEHNRRRAQMLEDIGPYQKPTSEDRSRTHASVGKRAHNTSGIKGVFWNTQKKRWHAMAMVNYKNKHLGFFTNIADAAAAYKKFAIETWGDFANYATEEEVAAAVLMHSQPKLPPQSNLNVEDLF